jgi:signal transduction histidine kinase/DNA-binding response OmpR family regulator
MQTQKNIQMSDILDEIARGSSLDQSLGLITQKAIADLQALTCKIWVVKHGDICEQCPLADICQNRQMCLHLAASNDSPIEKEYPRIPISALNTSLIVRGGISDFKDGNQAGEKLFGLQQKQNADSANSYALYPLRGISGTVGLIGIFNNRLIEKNELQVLAQLSPAAVAAIRVAELQARCDALRYQVEKSSPDAAHSDTALAKQLQEANAQLKNQIEHLLGERDALLQTREVNQQQLATLEKENARLRISVNTLSAEKWEEAQRKVEESAKAESNNLQEEHTQMQQALAAYEKDVNQLKAEQNILRDELSERQNAMLLLKAELSVRQNELEEMRETVQRLEEKLSLLEETNEELRDYNTTLVEKIESLENSASAKEEAQTTIAGAADAETTLQQLQDAHSQLSEENVQLAEVNERLHEKYKDVETRFGEVEKENAELSEANAHFAEALKQLEALVPKLEESVDNLSSRIELSERLCAEMEQRNRFLAEENRILTTKAQTNSKLIANVSHELRNPMNSIIGFTSLILDDPTVKLTDKHRHHLERIADNSRELSEFINEILDFSKIEAGRMDVYAESVELRDVVDRAVNIAESLKDNDAVKIHTALADDLPTLCTDRTKLQQILLNLLSNAVKFTDEGEIKITASRADDDRLQISVSDTGVGITEADLPKIFEEFYQANHPNRYGKTGTGLGLAITRRLVTLLEGDIEVASKVGEGSLFVVTLPVEIESSAAATTEAEAQELDPERTALIVSEDAATVYLVKKYLTEIGYSVATTADVEHGAEVVSMAKPALIVVDFDAVESPEKVVRQMANSLEKGKLIAFSADVNLKNRALNCGANVFLHKPIEREELLEALDASKSSVADFVLVVDDDADALAIVQAMLEDSGLEVKTATNGREAIDIVSHQKPQAIVLDLMLPEMDGFEVAYRLRLNPLWREIPVVLLTARDLSNEERAVLNYETTSIIQKGNFSREDLLAKINEMAGENRNDEQ